MKKNIIYLVLLLTANISYAQITKEHTYVVDSIDEQWHEYYLITPPLQVVYETFREESEAVKYAVIHANCSTIVAKEHYISLYDLDHSLDKEINIERPSHYPDSVTVDRYNYIWDETTQTGKDTMIENTELLRYEPFVSLLSSKIFNNDDDIEFLVLWDGDDEFVDIDSLYLYNTEGEILFNFGAVDVQFYRNNNSNEYIKNNLIYKVGDEYKFMIIRPENENSQATFDIYSLKNSITKVSSTKSTISTNAYPNPTNNIITIPYNLENGENAILKIFDCNGVKIIEKRIDSTFNTLDINVSELTKGIYLYKYNNVSERFIVK